VAIIVSVTQAQQKPDLNKTRFEMMEKRIQNLEKRLANIEEKLTPRFLPADAHE
jgi:chaperonin cofactor prefoldin